MDPIGSRTRLVCVLPGLAAGLFLARVIAEAPRVAWPPLALLVLVLGACLAGAWVADRLARHDAALPLVPALILLVYAFWPARDWHVTIVVLAVALFSQLLSRFTRFAPEAHTYHASRVTFHASPSSSFVVRLLSPLTFHVSRLALLIFLSALAVYLATVQKDVLPADNGEFQLATTMLGVLHQPGFPLYTLVGKLFTLLPLGTPALRLNLLSVFLAAGTLALVGSTVRVMLSRDSGLTVGGVAGALAAVLALGTATTYWAQATTANIRMPTVFFTALCLYALVAYRQRPADRDRYLTLFALALSLGIGHHLSLGSLGLVFVAYLILVDPALLRQPRRWWRPLLVAALAQLVWLYLPIRAAIAPTPETRGLTSLSGFLWYALGQGFAGDMFAFAGPDHLLERLALLPALFQFQMNLVLLAGALLGAILLLRRDWRTGLMLVAALVLFTFITITYRAPQTVEYTMPAYVLLAVLIGYGVGQVSNVRTFLPAGETGNQLLRPEIVTACFALAAGVIVAGIANGAAHAPSFLALAGDRSTRAYVEPILRGAPPNAIILSDWHYATPMWYLQQVEGQRPDVTVRYVYPIGGQEWSQVWRGLIEVNAPYTPTIVTHYWGQTYSTLPYTFEPFGQAWLVRQGPTFDAPRDLGQLSAVFDGQIRLLGARASATRASPGQTVQVTIAWQTVGRLDRDYAFTVQLWDANNARRTNRDLGYPTRTFTPGEVRLDQFTLPLEPSLMPGHYRVMVGVYYVPPEGGWRNLKAGGDEFIPIASVDVVPGSEALPTLHPLDVPLAGGPSLTGVDYDSSTPALRVYLHWRGPSPAGLVTRLGDATAALPELPAGTTWVTGYDLPITDVPSAAALRLRVSGPNRRPLLGVGAWGWPALDVPLPAVTPGNRYILLDNQMLLAGVYTPARKVAPGQSIDVTLRFLSRKPLVSDNVVSVQIASADGVRLPPSDDHPAANAIPTLKWIAGSQVDDRRLLPVLADIAPGRLTGILRVYDGFRQEMLPPLDARMEDVPLGDWNVITAP